MFLLQHSRKLLLHFTQLSSPIHRSSVYCYSTSKLNCESSAISQFLTQKHQISPQLASRVASSLTRLNNPGNSDSVISFLKQSGFSNTQLERVIQTRPQLLSSSLDETLKPKFQFLQDFGFSDSEIAELFSRDSIVLNYSLSNRIAPALSVLKGLLGSNAEVKKLVLVTSWFLGRDLDKRLLPNINYLTSCGVEMDQIRRSLSSYRRFFLLDPETVKQAAHRADLLGADRSSRMFLHAVRVVGSVSEETWERKLQGFRELGFPEDDIPRMFRKMPNVFTVSLEKVKKIKEILLATGKYSMESIVDNPTSLTVSAEKRYKPRLSVLEVLESKNLIQEWPALGTLCKMTDETFFKGYVAPHLNGIVVSSNSFSEIAEILETRLNRVFL